MTFNTGNPIGSTDARDLSDNAENFDKALGTLEATWTDRLGVTRDSFEGRLEKCSFYRVGTFSAGYTLTNMRQTLEYSGHEYSWAGTFPKVVAAGKTPATSGGIGAGAWVDRTDVTLRSELISHDGDSLVGYATYAQIRLYSGNLQSIRCGGRTEIHGGDKAHGKFYRDDADTTSADNDGTVLIDALDRRWKRKFTGSVLAEWWGAGDGVVSSAAIQNMINSFPAASQTKQTPSVDWQDAAYVMESPIWIYENDGLDLSGKSSSSTRFVIKDTFNVVMPDNFSAINGAYNGYTYDTNPALFIVAARRRTQSPSQGYVAANQAAYGLKLSGFRVENNGMFRKAIDLLYAPEITRLQMNDVVGWGCKYGQNSFVCYDSDYKKVYFDECVRPLYILNGTSLSINVGCSRCEKGFKINAYYSTMNSCFVDAWGHNDSGALVSDSYAYEITGIGWTLNSCGAEYGYGGLFNCNDNLPRTSIIFNGGAFFGGSSVGDPAYGGQTMLAEFGVSAYGMSYFNNATVEFNGVGVRQLVENGVGVLTKFPINIGSNCNISVRGLLGFEGTSASSRTRWSTIKDFEIIGSSSVITPITQRDKIYSYAKTSSDVVYEAGTTTIPFNTIVHDEYGSTNASGITTIPVTGFYRLDVNLTLIGVKANYLVITDGNNEIMRCDLTATSESISKNIRVLIVKGTNMKVQLSVASGGSVTVKQDSSFTIEMC